MIDVKHLSKSFGEVEVLKDINETIDKGEKVVIVGPSGSGKSTFLRCLNLMEKPTSGDIFFEGENITQANEHEMNKLRQRMGMVFQHFNLFPHLTIKKNITLAPVKLGLMTADEADKKAEELKAVHIDRSKNGLCNIEVGVNFLDILTNVERISDHCSNIAVYLIANQEKYKSLKKHEYLDKLHRNGPDYYEKLLAEYSEKFAL